MTAIAFDLSAPFPDILPNPLFPSVPGACVCDKSHLILSLIFVFCNAIVHFRFKTIMIINGAYSGICSGMLKGYFRRESLAEMLKPPVASRDIYLLVARSCYSPLSGIL